MSDIMGSVIFGQAATDCTHAQVVDAIKAAGMPPELGRELRPRSAFIRTMKELARQNAVAADFRDKARDDDNAIEFAFVCRDMASEGVIGYEATAVVRWDKHSHQITILRTPPGATAEGVLAKATEIMLAAKNKWSSTDVNLLVRKYLGRYAKQIPLKAGVAFVPVVASHAVDAIKVFYETLGMQYWVLPVGYSDKQASDVQESVVLEMKKEIALILKKVADLKTTGGLTKRIAKTKMMDLQKSLQQYRTLAQTVRASMEELIESVGDESLAITQSVAPMQSLLAQARSGGKVSPLLVDLLSADEENTDAQELRKVMAASVALPEVDVDVPDADDNMPLFQAVHPMPINIDI